MARDAPFHVAIVGGGACGLATLLQLLRKAPSGIRIVLFEKNLSVGPGLAYSAACDGTHINMHSNQMSLYANDPNHFLQWMKTNHCTTGKSDFPSRPHYGKYLGGLTLSAVELAAERGIELVMIQDEIVDVRKQSLGWTVHTSDGTVYDSSAVTLATGNFMPTIHKQLVGKPLYFDRPWPNERLLAIPKSASICIVGSRLTAIDEALYMISHGYTGTITLVSRSGQLPKVQGDSKKYERVYSLYNLARELENEGSGSILTIGKRVYDEMRMHDESRGIKSDKMYFSSEDGDVTSQFRVDVECARQGKVPGQNVLRSTAPIIERYWRAIDDASKQAFMRLYMSEWVIHRHAMPLHTAEKVLRLLESGQLRVMAVKSEPIQWSNGVFSIPTVSQGILHADAVIEATGIEYDPAKLEMPLMQNLLARKTVKPHFAGGVELDFDTHEVEKGLYVVGAMTRGVHFYSTAIDRNVVQAERAADSILGLPPRKSLHVALFVGQGLYPQLIMSKVVPRLLASGHVPFIYLTEKKESNEARMFELREMDFYERNLFQDHIMPYLGSNCENVGPCMTAQQLRTRYGILVQNVSDVNAKDFVRSLSANHIDVGYSLTSEQRFKTDIMSHFQSRKGLWNLHPGVLPRYRGVLTTLRAMANREEKFGYTMHEVSEDWNTGAIIGIREAPINYSKAILNYKDDVWGIGVDMVEDLTEQISRGGTPKALAPIEPKEKYHTFPTMGELAGYYEQGLRLVDGEGIKEVIIREFAPEGGEEKLAGIIDNACDQWYNSNDAF